MNDFKIGFGFDFHKLTKGRVDYFKIYNHEFNIVESLIERERINCTLDDVLEKITSKPLKFYADIATFIVIFAIICSSASCTLRRL